MKTSARNILLSVLLVAATTAFGALPPVDVTVSDASGKVAFRGKTGANGTFSTPKLQPGNYVVQFNSSKVKGDHAIVVSAGKKKVTADAVAAEKFAKGGIAMRVDVGSGLNITGQVAEVGVAEAGAGNAKVKIINGKRYVWVGSEMGSNLGGRWVEEGSATGLNTGRMRSDTVQDLQTRGSQGAAPTGSGR